jgi:xanthine dehydrogenase YagS FAD-binding subunit
MRDFRYARADDPSQAVALLAGEPGARLIGGGTDMVNLLKERIERPALLVDISRIPLNQVVDAPTGLHLGALARMSDVAAHPGVRAGYPAVAESLEQSASAQLRNMATMGGNLLQRTRCPYFRAETDLPCNKRRPGTGCAAVAGEHRGTAIFGTSRACVATHPSDVAVALVALDATVHIQGPGAERTVALTDLHRLPGGEPHRDTVLEPDEMIVAIDVPATPLAATSHYLKVRERASYEFALVSAATAVLVEDGVIREARVALGGVAPKPWRLRDAERALIGVPCEPGAVRRAVEPAFAAARLLPGNAFKVELATRTVVRALTGQQELP